ncbi:hypothetical protein FRB99_006779 [Tulasnella sp. 403]|nr:hypothetical protein FRB99_006779 [Tulasnella sp. 403]
MKSVLLAGVVLLLRLYIGFLDLVAYCIVLLLVRLEKLNPSPAQNHVPPASTVEKTPDFVDGVMNGETPDDAPLSTLPGHSNELSLPPTAATPLLHPFSADVTLATSGSIPPTYLAKESSHRKPKGYNNAGISGDTLVFLRMMEDLGAAPLRVMKSVITDFEISSRVGTVTTGSMKASPVW